jgi:hypothetical protein
MNNNINHYALETGYRTTTAGPIVTTPGGKTLWFTGGPVFHGIRHLFRIELRESVDDGRIWSAPRVFLKGSIREAPAMSAVLALKSGKLLAFGSWYGGYDYKTHDPDKSRNEGFTVVSTDESLTWSKTRPLVAERYLSSVLSAAQLSTGRIVFPFGYLQKEPKGNLAVSAVYSDDEGETWRRSPSILKAGGGGFESGACEPSVIELPDGRLWMLIRAQTGFQWESFSTDGGETWTEAKPSRFPSSNAPAVLYRLSSGRIIVAWNNSVEHAYARHSLMLAATDDGKSFFGFREIAHTDYPMVNPETYWGVMYPYLAETRDQRILVSYNFGDWTYNWARLARIEPAWLDEREWHEDFREGISSWCSLGAVGGEYDKQLVEPGDGRPGACLRIGWQKPGPCGLVCNFPLLEKGTMEIQLRVIEPGACLLWHNSFLLPGSEKEAVVRVRFGADGKIFIGAGMPRIHEAEKKPWGPQYSYCAYPVESELQYPLCVKMKERFTLTLHCDCRSGRAGIAINDGPEVSVKIGGIFGLCFIGAAVVEGGGIELRELRTKIDV